MGKVFSDSCIIKQQWFQYNVKARTILDCSHYIKC
jgi:hypothetical protein